MCKSAREIAAMPVLAGLVSCALFQSALAQQTPIPPAPSSLPAAVSYAQPLWQLAQADDGSRRSASMQLAVLYPNVGEPYRGIFSKIIEGIEDKTHSRVRSIALDNNADLNELKNQLKKNGVRAVIALGRHGLKASNSLDRDIAVVVGGVVSVPEADARQLSGISFTPDPGALFERLRSLLPETRRIFVVYDPALNETLMRLAREAAHAQKLELVTLPAHDLATAARQYESAFGQLDNRRDALWLPHDPTTVEENTIMPLILKQAWNGSVPIFSSNFLHVKKGVLFALYPNNTELGKTLANTAMAALTGESRKRGVQPLRDLLAALNLRTASRIGLNLSQQQQRAFDFVFPEP